MVIPIAERRAGGPEKEVVEPEGAGDWQSRTVLKQKFVHKKAFVKSHQYNTRGHLRTAGREADRARGWATISVPEKDGTHGLEGL